MREISLKLDNSEYLKSRHSSLTAPMKFLTDMSKHGRRRGSGRRGRRGRCERCCGGSGLRRWVYVSVGLCGLIAATPISRIRVRVPVWLFSSSPSASLRSHFMAPKEPCAKYQYVLTSSGPKIVPVRDNVSKEEESPADYNAGGYLPVKIHDVFKDGRYLVVRKLGYSPFTPFQPFLILLTAGATSLPSGSFMIPSAFPYLLLRSLFHSPQPIPLFCPQGRQVRFPLC